MGTITLPNVRATSDITVMVRLKYSGVAIDWTGLRDIKALIYSDEQKAIAGRCDIEISDVDNTILVCNYAATKPQYLGVNRVIIQAKYHGRMNTYDKPAFNIVARNSEVAEREAVVIDSSAEESVEVDVFIEVTAVSTSLLDNAIAAAIRAAADAEEAAHLVPLQVLTDCREATEDAQEATAGAQQAKADADAAAENANTKAGLANEKAGDAAAAAALAAEKAALADEKAQLADAKAGDANAAAARAEAAAEHDVPYIGENGHWWRWDKDAGQYVDTGEKAQGDKGEKGDKGDQGNTGSSVEYPFELVDNIITDDNTKSLAASQGVVLKGLIDAGFLLCGNAVPNTVPGTPLGKVCYIAIEPGVYTNFDSIKVFPGTLAILYRSNGVWNKKEIRPVYVSNLKMQNCIQELYLETQADITSLRLSIMTWTGTTLSINIKDTDGNIVSAVVNRPTKPYEAVPLSTYVTSPIEVKGYIVMNENIDTVTLPSGYPLYESCANLLFKPFITEALVGEYKADIAAMKAHIQKEEAPICVARINRGALNPNGLYNNSYISISRRFTPTHDALLVFGNKDAAAVTNKFFDFFGFYVHEIDTDSGLIYCPQNATQFGTSVMNASTTDSILPVIVGAVNNIDGENTSKWFTGQNHAYGNVSSGPSRTMREISNDVWVDNVPVAIGQLGVRGKKCIIEVVNRVQAYNTVKQDGTGREVIEQKITVEMDNSRCIVRVDYLALEDVIFYNIPGAGQYGAPNTSRQFRLIGSTSKMGLYDFSATAVSPSADDRKINCIQMLWNGYGLDLVVRNYGLGNLAYNTSQNNAYLSSSSKVYTRLTEEGAEIALAQGSKIGFEIEYNTFQNVK